MASSELLSRRAQRRAAIARRRRRGVATVAAAFSACVMVLSGGAMAAGWDEHEPVAFDWDELRVGVTVGETGADAVGGSSGEPAIVEGILPDDPVTAEPEPEPVVEEPAPDEEPPAEEEPEQPEDGFCEGGVAEAIAAGDDAAAIEAAGGAEAFREAVLDGTAGACVSLSDPSHTWVVVNKHRALEPNDFAPETVLPETRSIVGGQVAVSAVVEFDAMISGAREAGAGDIALESGYRSYQTQIAAYDSQVATRGVEGADLTSARPGYSEHQTGLAVDLVACDDAGGCGSIYDFGGTAQQAWIAENSWRYGWIVRYQENTTDRTGYEPEPWHLRFVGTDLAAAYMEGGYETLEEFFGLEPAPNYG